MIAPKNVIISNTIFEKINLNHTYYLFADVKNIDLNLLTINKNYTHAVSYEIKYITMQILIFKILIKMFLFVLVLVI